MVNVSDMTTLPPIPIPPGKEYTEDKLPHLLFHLGERPVILEACEKAGIHHMALEIAMKDDSELRKQVNWAMRVGMNAVEAQIADKALGRKVPRTYQGKIVQEVNPKTGETEIVYDIVYDSAMLKKFAERLAPDLYGDQVDVNHKVSTVTYMPADVMETEFEQMLALQADKTEAIMAENRKEFDAEIAAAEGVVDAEFEEIEVDNEEDIEDLI